MTRTTFTIPLGQKTPHEANEIIRKVLKKHKYTVRMIKGELFWAYGNPKYEIIPCISSRIIKNNLILWGWMYDEEENEENDLIPHYLSDCPKRWVKAIMKEIAYLIKYKK